MGEVYALQKRGSYCLIFIESAKPLNLHCSVIFPSSTTSAEDRFD